MKHRLVHLDCLRGLAALLVCISHLSAFLFIPFKQIISPGILVKGFYFLSSLGHQAVLLFFVLSGYLVGGSVIKSFQLQRWSWRDYLLRRMTRLWVVLIPALLLTFFWDLIGSHLNPAGYQGNWHQIYGSGPEKGAPVSLGANTFLGNLFFLQTIVVPVYGSNSPLWSIANEFWYYLLFPLLISVFLIRSVTWKVVSMFLAVAILFFLPRSIICLGFAWVLGAAVFYLQQKRWAIRCFSSPLFLFGSIILAGMILVVSRMGMLGDLFDSFLGLSFVPLVAACSVRAGSHGIYSKLSAAVSEFSYTLYLVHFPIMAFLFFIFMQGRQLPLNPLSIGVFSVVLVLVTLYASAVWWCFERRTDNIRNLIVSYLFKNDRM